MNVGGEAVLPQNSSTVLPSEKRALFISNPHAGRGRARRLFRSLPGTARELGWEVAVRETQQAGDEVELAAEAQRQGWPVVIAVGGDGTVHGVANGLLRDGPTDTVLAHVPIGTGNDFAKMVGLNKARHPDRNLRLVLEGRVSRLDVGVALGEYFVNGLGIGFGAAVARNILEYRRLRGFALYLAAVYRTFFSFKAPQLEVRADEHSESGTILMTEIAIGKTAGGGFKLTPAADPRDGLLDVCIIRDVGIPTFLRYIPRVLRGTHTTLAPVTVFQTRQVDVTSLSGSPVVHLDGEVRLPGETSVAARIQPASLPALCAR
jgi:YegS/Rv2252/BmrU family lipid kinase